MSLLTATNLLHTAQAALSTYTAYYTYLSATKQQTYEKKTEKAAKYSNTAEYHLWETRKTLGGGAMGVLASLLTSLSLLSTNSTTSTPSEHTTSPAILSITSFAIAIFLGLSHTHISNYWRNSAKVPLPGMKDYNDSISTVAVMRACIGFLGISWGVAGGLYLFSAVF